MKGGTPFHLGVVLAIEVCRWEQDVFGSVDGSGNNIDVGDG